MAAMRPPAGTGTLSLDYQAGYAAGYAAGFAACKDASEAASAQAQPPVNTELEVEQFIAENGLNEPGEEQAANALRTVSASIQRYVLDLGSLNGCRSRSAGLLGRVAKAQSAGLASMAPAPPVVATASLASEVEAFIASNQLNERAATAFQSVSPAVQRAVMDLGSLLSCRNPSAGCLGRIRDAQSGKVPLGASAVASAQHSAWPPELHGGAGLEERVESFIAEHQLDERAGSALRGVGPMVQRQVLDLGSLTGCRSASAGCLGRIQKIQSGGLQASQTAMAQHHGGMANGFNSDSLAEEVEVFIMENGLDEKAANALRTVGPIVQRGVMDLGSLQGCKAPSAGCLGRIRDIQSGGRRPAPMVDPGMRMAGAHHMPAGGFAGVPAAPGFGAGAAAGHQMGLGPVGGHPATARPGMRQGFMQPFAPY